MLTSAEIFCNNVKKLRKEHKLSKKQMSNLLGIGTKTLTSIENGVIPHRARAELIFTICDNFDISIKELFTA